MGITEGNGIELIKKAQRGDKGAMKDIVWRFTPFIIKTCRKIYVKGYELEDLIQIGQVSVINSIKKYEINRKYAFTTYAINTIKINFYRLIKYRINSIRECSLNRVNNQGYELIENLTSLDNVENKVIKNEEQLSLYEGINRLSGKEKEIIVWFYFQNKTLEEYARNKEICYRAAVERKRRAVKNLKIYMSPFHKI